MAGPQPQPPTRVQSCQPAIHYSQASCPITTIGNATSNTIFSIITNTTGTIPYDASSPPSQPLHMMIHKILNRDPKDETPFRLLEDDETGV